MKAYIGNVDWADEGDIFFFSVENEEKLQTMKELLEIYIKLNLFHEEVEIYWGTNEWFCFSGEDLLDFINKSKDISDKELEVFRKFKVKGLDIYYEILYVLKSHTLPTWYYYEHKSDFPNISKEEISKIEPLFVELFGKKAWAEIKI